MIPLAPREVRVWPVKLAASDEWIAKCKTLLSPEERARADRFYFPYLTRNYAISHCVLRVLLGGFLSVEPQEVIFVLGRNGKPALPAPERMQFNMSHSQDLALYAITMDCPLGVDVECIRSIDSLEDISRRFFHAAESAALLSVPASERDAAFYRCWTRKEAYIKAVGDGLSIPLDTFQVSLGREEPARFLQLSVGGEWSLHNLEPAPGFAGALAYPDSPRPLTLEPLITAEDLLVTLGQP